MFDLPSLYFGAFLGVFAFTLVETCRQTRRIVRRGRAWSRQNGYLYMIWSEAVVNLVFAVVTILHLDGGLGGSLALYLATVTLWALQTQLLSQIIANRVSLIMVSRQRATWMRWGLFALILAVNVAVYVIWIPANMPGASPGRRRLNDIFEKFEKSFFLVVDLGMNAFFLYLVRFRLIAGGLPKYWALFKMNTVLIVVSTSMDAALLGMLSLSDPYVYVQFAPLAYTIKLYIELVMTSLIARVVSSETAATGQIAGGGSLHYAPSYQPPLPMGHDRYGDKYGSTKSIFGDKSVFGDAAAAATTTSKFDAMSIRSSSAALSSHAADVEGRHEAPGDEAYHLSPVPESVPEASIIKTVTTTVVSSDRNESSSSPRGSVAGSVKSHKSHRSYRSYKSHKSHKSSRSRTRLFHSDESQSPLPPPLPPLPDDGASILTMTTATTTTTSGPRDSRHPLTSRFNRRNR